MRTKSYSFAGNSLVTLKDQDWFEKQQVAGRAVASCLATSKKLIKSGADISLKDLEAECEKIISDFNCTPTFKNYKGFPGSICASVNKQLVHGIPSDYRLKNGDVVKIDLGATYNGAIADAAITAVHGGVNSKYKKLIETCKKSLYEAIKSIQIGKRIGIIGYTINKYTEAQGFSLITKYGGHGISWEMPHASPFIANKSKRDEGIRIQPGLTIAIEPMLVMGYSDKTKVDKDGWTVYTKDVSAHFEHTVFVADDKIHIMTDYENLRS